MRVSGHSYGDSIAYPHRYRSRRVLRQEMLSAVLELVHPAQFKALPPSPNAIISKAEVMGVATYNEFFRTQWY